MLGLGRWKVSKLGHPPHLPRLSALTSEVRASLLGRIHVGLLTQPSYFVLTFLPFGACSLLPGTELDELQSRALGTCIWPLDST